MELKNQFELIALNRKSKGTMDSKKLMKKIRSLNIMFDNDDHHDAHEFLIWLLNQINEEIVADAKKNAMNKVKKDEA